jgi:ATP-dependent DNA helicase RecQ
MVRALNFLEERGHITLRAAGVRQGYRVVQAPEDLTSVGRELLCRFAVREQSDIARLRAVTELLEGSGCLVRRLLAYFGEDLGRDCGHCGACAGDEPSPLVRAPGSTAIPFPEEVLAMPAESPGLGSRASDHALSLRIELACAHHRAADPASPFRLHVGTAVQ